MAITDLIPWKKKETNLDVRRGREEEALVDLRTQMNRIFDNFFERPINLSPFFGETAFGDFVPYVDVSETENEFTVEAELPGMESADIDITLDWKTLTISGEKRAEKEEKGKRFYRVERAYGSFHRSIPLPEGVDENKIEAAFKRGVLKVKLPKTGEAQKRGKRISIKKG